MRDRVHETADTDGQPSSTNGLRGEYRSENQRCHAGNLPASVAAGPQEPHVPDA